MLAKVEDVLKRGNASDPPAYTLILGAGASFGVVPTAKEMLGFPDTRTGNVHEKSIPVWLAQQLAPDLNPGEEVARFECSREFWKKFCGENIANDKCKRIEIGADGFPTTRSIATAYQSVFDTASVGGLDTPERHRNYMRAVTMSADPGSTQLNATHFYLASLLSLQKRTGDLGSDKKSLYTGRREFARTIFTTNFDPILQTSLQLFQLLYYMTDRPEFLSADALQTDHHPAVHLFYAHGSVHRPYMANTDNQIALLKQQNARDLAAYLGNHGVIVLGYSGWDDCLLEALNQTKTFSNNLYWLARGEDSLSDDVRRFLATHPNAYWVAIDDGGSFMAELHGRLCPGAPNTEMLYNPIHPLLNQLGCVNLGGIQASILGEKAVGEKVGLTSDAPPNVEMIRLQVIARLKDAQKLFTELTAGNVGELERQADLSYVNSDWDAALAAYQRLLDIPGTSKKDRAVALFRRGVCYDAKEQVDKGMADFTAVIELSDAPVDLVLKALNNRGRRHGKNGAIDNAIADFTAVINSPVASVYQVSSALFNRGIAQGDKGERLKEIEDYTSVINLKDAPISVVAKVLVNRGYCYARRGEASKARADYDAVVAMADAPSEATEKANALIAELN